MTAHAKARITNAQKGLIHVAKTQLGLSEEEYRDSLAAFGGGAQSSRDLSQEQFKAVMKHFEACGFKQLYRPRSHGDAPNIQEMLPEKRGVMVLIGQTLTKLGKSWAYAGGIAERMRLAEKWEWRSKEDLQKVLAALVYASRKPAKARRRQRKRA